MLVVYHEDNDFLKEVLTFLKAQDILYNVVFREDLAGKHYLGQDAVLVVGGDGTFLRASHLNKDLPILGINPDPKRKEGFFMQMTRSDYQKKLPSMLKTGKTILLSRLKVTINGTVLPEMVLNEAYVGSNNPYAVFNYDVIVGRKKEFQRSSGILIGTPAGSNGWLKSAGGAVMDLESEKFQYLVREPYEGRLTGAFQLKQGILSDKMTIIPKSRGIVVIDSISRQYEIEIDDQIEVTKTVHLRYLQ